MSFGAGDARKRPSFMDSFRAALTPAPLPPDDGKPLVRPNTVTIASVLAMAAGVVFVLNTRLTRLESLACADYSGPRATDHLLRQRRRPGELIRSPQP